MTNLGKVRAVQKTLKSLRRTYLRPTDERVAVRDAAQYANDCCFCNPPPDAGAEQKERWASRWMAKYEAKLAEMTR